MLNKKISPELLDGIYFNSNIFEEFKGKINSRLLDEDFYQQFISTEMITEGYLSYDTLELDIVFSAVVNKIGSNDYEITCANSSGYDYYMSLKQEGPVYEDADIVTVRYKQGIGRLQKILFVFLEDELYGIYATNKFEQCPPRIE